MEKPKRSNSWYLLVLWTVVPIALTAILFYVTFFHIATPAIKDYLIQSKKETIRELTISASSILKTYERRVVAGRIDLKEAQKDAIAHIRALRYGPEGLDYFWITDLNLNMIMHPYRTDLEGVNISGLKDPNGKLLFVEFVKAAETQKAGYVDYMWQWKDDPNRIVPKMSYALVFEPWGWVIGTGAYIEDVNETINTITNNLTGIFSLVMALILALLATITGFSIKIERKKNAVETALIKRREKYHSVVNNANEAIFIVYDEVMQYANPKSAEIMECSREELLNTPFIEFVHEKDRAMVMDRYKRRLQGESVPDVYAIRAESRSGIKWLEIKPIPMNWDNKPSILVFASDITERKKAEDKLQAAHQLLEKKVDERTKELKKTAEKAESAAKVRTNFLNNMSHEFKTPLHQILNYSQFGIQKFDRAGKDKLLYYFSSIEKIGKRLTSLVNDILELSRLESGKMDYTMSMVDLDKLVRSISEFLFLESGKKVHLKLETMDSPLVFCDEAKINKVVRILLTNAVKFTPPHKNVSVSIKPGEITVHSPVKGEQTVSAVVVEIKDEGIGIPKNELKLIFDKFVQSSKTASGAGGKGLGLSICKEIIKAHNGEIWAENNPNEGATLSFQLPIQPITRD